LDQTLYYNAGAREGTTKEDPVGWSSSQFVCLKRMHRFKASVERKFKGGVGAATD